MRSRSGLLLAAALAMTAGMNTPSTFEIRRRDGDDDLWRGNGKPDTDNRGRRAEKDVIAQQKAQAKRDRKNAKRVAAASHNA